MTNYAARGRPPRTLTDEEQTKILRVTGDHARGFRDHVLISLALGTGLREHELAALDVGDVRDERGKIRRRVRLRVWKGHRRARAGAGGEEVILPDECRRKLERWLRRHPTAALSDACALFPSREGAFFGTGRLSTRRIRSLWRGWQSVAGFERLHPFHALRHTFVTNVYRRSGGDVVAAMRLARHRRLETTQVYAHASDEDLERIARRLPS